MFGLKSLNILGSKAELASLPEGKLLINTVNAHSYNTARKDSLFAEALTNGDVFDFSLVLWSVLPCGGRSMAWIGSIDCSKSRSVCGGGILLGMRCSF